ncbi:MAG: DUF3570 domain-containing protein [Kiritimatiellaeota bacterium]|nr:DUF3570 domain-containing protein [Kiritimatiellota bacterium]
MRRQSLALAVLLPLLPIRRAEAEDRVDFKTLYYKEDGNRMQVVSPSAAIEKEIVPSLTIKLQGVYDIISGATPTGAPPPPRAPAVTTRPSTPSAPAPSSGESENGGGGGDYRFHRVGNVQDLRAIPLRAWSKAGATPAAAPAPAPASGGGGSPTTTANTPAPDPKQKVPVVNSSDRRTCLVMDVNKTLANHTLGVELAYSTESDYWSKSVALRDAIDFNQKNTTLLIGADYNHDLVRGTFQTTDANKNTVDGMVGLSQLLDPDTIVTLNFTFGRAQGYLTDPYKIAELNGQLVGERRPDERRKQVVYAALSHYIEPMEASVEAGYRYYHDTFGVVAHTVEVAWYQKLGKSFILRPMARYYEQGAADFYAVRFNGSPEFFSADYRLSEMSGIGYGLKLIWKITPNFSVDVDGERYELQGRDGVTADDAYPGATIVMAGASLWF